MYHSLHAMLERQIPWWLHGREPHYTVATLVVPFVNDLMLNFNTQIRAHEARTEDPRKIEFHKILLAINKNLIKQCEKLYQSPSPHLMP